MILNHTKHTLTRENLVVIKAREPHTYFPVEEPWETRWILFSGENINPLLTLLGMEKSTVVSVADEKLLHKRFNELLAMCSEDFNHLTASHQVYALLCEISNWYTRQSRMETSEIMTRTTAYIEAHFNRLLTLKELSELNGVSEQYLCRLFKKYYQTRPFEYINLVRVKKAQEQLLSTDKTITQIAAECCFDSLSYFGKRFKEHVGVSPSQFVKLYKNQR